MMKYRFIFLVYFLCSAVLLSAQEVSVNSPDGKLMFKLSAAGGQLHYQILRQGSVVMAPSGMGLVISGKEFGAAEKLSLLSKKTINKTFPYRGIHTTALHYANAAVIKIASADPSEDFELETQVFNDGVAFRYRIANMGGVKVEKELTGFLLPDGADAWWQDDVQNYEGSYRKTKVSDINANQKIGLPITFKLADSKNYVAITEGGLENFAGMYLTKAESNSFSASLASEVLLPGEVLSPWRIVQVSEDLNTLVNSDIVGSVSAAPDPALFPKGFQTDWIKPGKCVWSWMTPTRSVTPENMRKFSDLASELNIPYNLVDDGWGRWKDGDKDAWALMKDLVDYSAQKNVKIWVWAAYPDNNGLKGLKDSVYMVNFFKRCKEIGIVGLKVDFMSSESQQMMGFYIRALREAAKLQLMLDFHGVNKPTGLSRTWPNEMSREAVRGLEYEGNTNYAEHNTILPFTRYLAGHGDYTPMSFQDYTGKTSLAHQVATAMIFTSPFLCLGTDPATLLQSQALTFIKQTPSVWEETIVLPGSEIGEVAGFARRSGKKWFVAYINGQTPREMDIPLSFLGKGKYSGVCLTDEHPVAVTKSFTSQSPLHHKLASGGGFVAVFEPL